MLPYIAYMDPMGYISLPIPTLKLSNKNGPWSPTINTSSRSSSALVKGMKKQAINMSIPSKIRKILYQMITGWLFGTWLFWLSIQLGMSSSQLTFTPSFFRGFFVKTTNRLIIVNPFHYIYIYIDDIEIDIYIYILWFPLVDHHQH